MDPIAMGERGLSGWYRKPAGLLAGAIAKRTRWTEQQIRAAIGWVLIGLVVLRFGRSLRRVLTAP